MSLKLSDFDYHLPPELIAQKPLPIRDESRLLVLHRDSGRIEHKRFTDFPEYFKAGDVIVANNSRVFKARLLGHRILPDGKMGGKIEFLMLRQRELCLWEGLFRMNAAVRIGQKFIIPLSGGKEIRGEILEILKAEGMHDQILGRFDQDPVEQGAGEVPLPPYIHRSAQTDDEAAYQTIYAKQTGSAAAPTAGFHFTPRVLDALRSRGVQWEEITLHVGAGTFLPVKHEEIREHRMHEEVFEIDPETAHRLNEAHDEKRVITAVGSTALRALESSALAHERLCSGRQSTSLFVYPGNHDFKFAGRMLTNFHLPRSTLLILVCAFAGRELILRAYEEAKKQNYRFFSYGDAMLIL